MQSNWYINFLENILNIYLIILIIIVYFLLMLYVHIIQMHLFIPIYNRIDIIKINSF
jgi:hypothetical protein